MDRREMIQPARIGRTEWRWVVLWTLAVLLLTSIPYLIGWRVAVRQGQTFGGFVIGVEDGNSYLAKMAQGARGHWLFHIVYTTEPHAGALVYLFYLLLGKLAAGVPAGDVALPIRLIWAYHVARWLCSAALLATTYRFVAEFVAEVGLRRLAWLMIALGGGLGWLLLALGQEDWLGSMPLDVILPEGFTFLVVLTLPHIALGRTLLLAGFLVWLRRGRLRFRGALFAGGLWLLTGLIVPIYPIVAAVVLGATLLAWWLVRREFPRRELGLAVVSGLVVAPVVVYSASLVLVNPVMQGWLDQNLILSPVPGHYLAAYLVPGLLAMAGLSWVWKQRADSQYWLLVAWFLVVPLLVYMPFNLQRRLVEGYQAPLTVLAVIGAGRVLWPTLNRYLRRPVLPVAALLVLMWPTSLVLLSGSSALAFSGQAPAFHTSAEVATAAWMTEHVPEDTCVLTGHAAGNFLAAWAPVRVYLGHGPETINYPIKAANVERFFASSTEDEWRRAFLDENGLEYVLAGPAETGSGSVNLDAILFLEPVAAQGDWTLYEVAPNDG